MSYGYFTKRETQPTEQEIAKILGVSKGAWDSFCSYLETEKGATKKYKFYGKNYGWALGFSRNGKSVISFYPTDQDFWFQVILNKKQEEAVLEKVGNEKLRSVMAETEPIHEGKWIFLKYSDVGDEHEVRAIIDIRMDRRTS